MNEPLAPEQVEQMRQRSTSAQAVFRDLLHTSQRERMLRGPGVYCAESLITLADDWHRLRVRLAALDAERDKLKAFKDWVHGFLDGKDVPHHPPGAHGAEDCCIEDRMDWLMDRLAALEARLFALEAAGDRLSDVLDEIDLEAKLGQVDVSYVQSVARPAIADWRQARGGEGEGKG